MADHNKKVKFSLNFISLSIVKYFCVEDKA